MGFTYIMESLPAGKRETMGNRWQAMFAIGEVVSILVITAMFAMMFKALPDIRIAWRDVWVGAGLTAGLMALTRALVWVMLPVAALTAAGHLLAILTSDRLR